MSWQGDNSTRNIFRLSPEEASHIADVAEEFVTGGRGMVQQLLRARRDVLKGVSHLIDGQIKELDQADDAIKDEARPRWRGGVGLGLFAFPARRTLAIKDELARLEGVILQGLAERVSQYSATAAERAASVGGTTAAGTGVGVGGGGIGGVGIGSVGFGGIGVGAGAEKIKID